jgi:hypothetical protein
VSLSDLTRRPVLLRGIKGPLVILQDNEGVLILVQSYNLTKEEILEIKCGNSYANPKLVLHIIIIVSGDDDVSITMPAHVLFNLILYLKLPSKLLEG